MGLGLYGLVITLAGMIGDLAESLIKRDSQVKDSECLGSRAGRCSGYYGFGYVFVGASLLVLDFDLADR